MTTNAGVAELFDLLESNKLVDVEEIKKVFHDHFLSTKDSWLVNGLFDYYISTNSLRAVEVLAGVREPHDKYLLDRLTEALSKASSQGQRVQALTLLGHVARRQPTWLYKLASHTLFRELLKLLKVENDTLSLMSALLLLVTLLPMLPAALGPYLYEIFDVFGRLASYYHHQSLSSSSTNLTSVSGLAGIDKDHLYLLHLQVGLYSLFHRLYAMYPCNFISYLRQQYVQHDQLTTFAHTVRPMLDSVRMHPLLVTASKETETSAARWKRMEHHDVVAECGRFALDRCREEVTVPSNARFTPILDHPTAYPAVNSTGVNSSTGGLTNGEEDTFWSPSMAMPPNSPPPLQTSTHEPRSTPSTPNSNANNNVARSGTSPPEAAVEATPETTPVKDLRQLSTRQLPVGSSAVRALGGFGNGPLGTNSRPSTPVSTNPTSLGFAVSGLGGGGDSHSILSQKINRLVAERQTVLQQSQTMSPVNVEPDTRTEEVDLSQDGKNDSWQEDQEVLEIVNSQTGNQAYGSNFADLRTESYDEANSQGVLADLSSTVQRLRFYSQCQPSVICQYGHFACKTRRTKSCPEMKVENKMESVEEGVGSLAEAKCMEEAATQTCETVPYEHLLLGLFTHRNQNSEHPSRQNSSDSRLSPSSMLDRYVEACARTGNVVSNEPNKSKTLYVKSRYRRRLDEDASEEVGEEDGLDGNGIYQQLQLMQMQLQFERQRREVHAERNRRLIGKLRDSRALEEHNSALLDRLRMVEKELENLKNELDRNKRETRQAEERHAEALRHWQSKCVEEQQQNKLLRERSESLELEIKQEKKKLASCERETRSAEAALFDAAHQLKDALKAANRGEELKRTLDTVQKKFLLLGEAQSRLRERSGGPMSMARQEAAQIQRAYAEELSNLRRQLDSRASLIEALRMRLVELEARETRKESQLIDQQRLLQDTKERHEAELNAVESKYQAQVEINLVLQTRILELHGSLEAATCSTSTATINVTSSASPKERSPPLSTSLASSSDGSHAIIPSGIMMNDCCDPGGEIPNLQAIVEPTPSPLRTGQRQTPKQD
ncbi:hamartin [Orussus abietinus]|uniref:hamartin n=1 Tax=Orussus abietinus TaxID=222816 RepID=UPI00062561A8|nr:hamartin [Orussus abietinus]XP_023289060.1 hamartin [Orussus abietinus]